MSDEPAYISIGSIDPRSFDEAAKLLCGEEPRANEPPERAQRYSQEHEYPQWRGNGYKYGGY